MKNWYYKSVNYDKDYQINLISPNKFGDKDGYVIANVWNADDNWVIEMFEDGINQGQMERYTDFAPEVFAYNKSLNISESTNWYQKTNHLYRIKPTNNKASFSIRATDNFGNIYHQSVPIVSISKNY